MKERSFLDTNILLYTDDQHNPTKQTKALNLLQEGWSSGLLVLSTQVLQEYFAASTRKLGIAPELAQRKITLLNQQLSIFSIAPEDILHAIDLHRLHQFSFWDSLIIRMAQKTACTILYSEDMQHGRIINHLKIINPFLV